MRPAYQAKVDSLGPVVHWRFDETSADTAVDRAGGLDGSYVDGVQLGADGVIGDGAARFDGVDDRVLVDPQEVMEIPDGTIEMWVTPSSLDGVQMLFSNNRPGRQAGDLEIMLRDDQVRVGIQGDGTQGGLDTDASGFQATAGTPLHLALSFGAGGLNLFLDGELVASDGFTGGLVGNDETVSIGARAEGSWAFEGVIDEFAFYDRALAPRDVAELFEAGNEGGAIEDPADDIVGDDDPDQGDGGLPDGAIASYSAVVDSLGPVVHWRFDETSADTAVDRAGGLDGSHVDGVQLGADGVIGDGAARFDGIDDRMTAAPLGAPTIAAFGDSLTAGNDIEDPSQFFDAELERALDDLGLNTTVLNRGVSGETTTDGLARVDDVISDDPDVVIIELGTNDALRTAPLDLVESNLRSIITDFDAAGVDVLLTSALAFYPERGRGYADEGARDDFEAIFPRLAEELDVELLDAGGSSQFLGGTREGTVITGGVLSDPSLNFDGLHPNARGVDEIAGRIAPQVADIASFAGNPLAEVDGTIEMWVTPSSLDGVQMLFSNNRPGRQAGDLEIMLRDDQVRVGIQGDGTQGGLDTDASGFQATAGTPLHLALSFGAGGLNLFLDGELVASDGFTGGLVGNDETVSIGARAEGSWAFEGVIDEVVVYDRALTSRDVADLFEAGSRQNNVVGTNGDDLLNGGVDDEIMDGRQGDDVILGGAGDDELLGDAGADDLVGGAGRDVLRGGPGADNYWYGSLAERGDTIWGFEAGPGGDVLRLADLLEGYQPETSDPNDFVALAESGGRTVLEVDPDGLGGDGMQIAVFEGVTNINNATVADLLLDGNLVLEPVTS